MKKKNVAFDLAGVWVCAVCVGLFWFVTTGIYEGAMIALRDNDNAPRTAAAFPFHIRVLGEIDDLLLYPFNLIPRQFVPDSPMVMIAPALFWGAVFYFADRAIFRTVRRQPTSAKPSR